MYGSQRSIGKRFEPELIRRFSIRFGLQFGILDLDDVDELPFSVLGRWYFAELEVQFLDRRLEEIAFLSCRVLHMVFNNLGTPGPEMFQLSPKLKPSEESATEPDFPEVDQESIDLFAAKTAQSNGALNGGGGS